MPSGKDWINKAKKLTPEQVERYSKAIHDLEEWDMFNKEYAWTRIFELPYLIKIGQLEKKDKLKKVV
jgi:hypothetical protein